MDYKKFKGILEAHKNTTIDIIAEKSSKCMEQVNLEIKGRYPIIADHSLSNRAYLLDDDILHAKKSLKKE